ncbi:hypothetical protein EZJ49_07130 [Bdellovibrio bacteriovorus]|uniref:hypothetical protein n=1 Tax=Bdellovibrio bacteriovorus TaxID=959 RepID=UPI0021CF668A|nr:hypothetical protein [Bdellovibrio bacteriovorus]UXR66019.1 hypothetical protein EZJ49_07130 [Bdellovibrio bacteriovorus]
MFIERVGLAYQCLVVGCALLLAGCNLSATLEDISIPSVAFEVGSKIKGGEDYPIQLQVSGANYSKAKIYYTLDGSTWSLLTELPRGVYNYTWTVPNGDYPQAGLRAVLENESGGSQQVENALEIDSTPPAIPSITDHTAALTRDTMAFFSITDCSDARFVKITESATPPSFDSSWAPCSTAAQSLASALDTDRVYPFHLWFADDVGNVNTALTTYSKTRDRTAPTLALTSFLSSLNINGGSTQNISWSYSDAHPHATPVSLSYSLDNGTSWVGIASNQNVSPYAWTTGALNSNQLRIKIVAQDILGNSTEVVSPVTHLIDSLDPLISLTLSSPNTDTLKGGDVLTVSWVATDANLGTDPVVPVYRVDGGPWTAFSGTTHYPSTGSLSWTIPANVNSSNVEFAVSVVDIVGRSKTATSLPYTIDNGAPALTWTSPADGSNGINGLTLSGACGSASGDIVTLSITGDISGTPTATCTAGSWSVNVTFSTGFGNKTITVSQSDDAGNVTSLTHTFTRNQLAAKTYDLSFIDPMYRQGQDPVIFNFSSLALDSEIAVWKLIFVDDADTTTEVQSFTSPTNAYSYTLTSGSQRHAKVQVVVTDVQGNVSTSTSSTFQVVSEVSTVIGKEPAIGNAVDGLPSIARFDAPYGVTRLGSSLILADRFYLRSIDTTVPAMPLVSTLVGSSFTTASTGVGREVSLGHAVGVATDGTYIYVSDHARHCILRYNPSPMAKTVEVLLGLCGTSGRPAANEDQNKANSRFYAPGDLKYHAGALYIADTENSCIRRYDMNDTVSVIAGYCGSAGYTLGNLGTNRIRIIGLDIDSSGNLWFTGRTNGTVNYLSLTAPYEVKAFAGTYAGLEILQLGTPPDTYIRSPYAVRAYNNGARNSLFVSDQYSQVVVEIPYDPANPQSFIGTSAIVAGQPGLNGSQAGPLGTNKLFVPSMLYLDGDELVISNTFSGQLVKLNIDTYVLSDWIGSPAELADFKTAGNAARISSPKFLTSDGTHLYLSAANSLRRIDLGAQTVTTIAGQGSLGGVVNGALGTSRLSQPWGIHKVAGGIYSLDRYASLIRFTDNSGNTRTIAGEPYVGGLLEAASNGDPSRFNSPTDLCSIGNSLYVVDNDNARIRRLDVGDINNPVTNPATTSLAGSSLGYQDGTGTGARFYEPVGMACISGGAHEGLYVNDTRAVRKVSLTGVVTTIAGSLTLTGGTDGVGTAARFDGLTGIDVVGNTLYLAENTGRFKMMDLDSGVVTSIINKDSSMAERAGRMWAYTVKSGFYDVKILGTSAYLTQPYVNTLIRVSLTDEEIELMVGYGQFRENYKADNDGSYARSVNYARGTNQVKVGDDLYVVSFYDSAVYKVDKDGLVTLYAGKIGAPGYIDGARLNARFYSSHYITAHSGNLYVSDYENHVLRKIDLATGMVTTVAGTVGEAGNIDGNATTVARLNQPYGLAVQGDYIYFVERTSSLIRAFNVATNEIITVMGVANDRGFSDGDKTTGRLFYPYALTALGNYLYVSDTDSGTLRKVDITDPVNATITTITGTHGQTGYADGVGAVVRTFNSTGLTNDGKYVYFTERGSNTIRRLNPATNEVTLWMGHPNFTGHRDGPLNEALLLKPIQPLFTPEGMYVSSGDHYNVRWVK